MENGIHRQSSIRERLKNSICCFTGNMHHYHNHESFEEGEGLCNKLHIPRTPISPISSSTSSSPWFKKSPTNNGSDFSYIKGRSHKSRVGRKHNHYRQSQSADFSYDPSSYALNFENESPHEDFPFQNFSSRLPPSPPSSSSKINYSDELPKEIVGLS
uniref:Uncharacterized protein LOC101494167 n=1 Tax=Cicer arietinum TaxID=3827 RepID=A0A1S2Y3F2_CICAR|nr:uncharacterized protein LOC101494167 [Cicer arietinum]